MKKYIIFYTQVFELLVKERKAYVKADIKSSKLG